MTAVQILVIILYTFSLTCIFFYSLIQLHLVFLSRNAYRVRVRKKNAQELDDYPYVTVQLPVYNEMYVVDRLIDAVSSIQYPKNRLEIQVLDDSTDETVSIIAKKVVEKQNQGIDIQHIRRSSREGFKAGALAAGLATAKGEFVAIFDADFVPPKNFLLNTLPIFKNKHTGAVQTCWGHLNREYSFLTEVQAFGLDGHFMIEQTGRYFGGFFLNFNGTAGIWRKTCVEDAGGWQYDTLTEDLDLSYRAQMKGWKIQYVTDTISPAELPVTMNALKSQQYRWNKGAAESLRKHLAAILKSPLPLRIKMHAVFHLLNSSIFIFVLTCAMLSIPMLYIQDAVLALQNYFYASSFFLLSFVSLVIFYWNAFRQSRPSFWRVLPHFLIQFFLFLSVSMGLALHNAIAVFEGYIGRKTPFVRTPKFHIVSPKDEWHSRKYLSKKIRLPALLEAGLTAYFFYGMCTAFALNNFGLFPFHLMLFAGFGTVFFYTIWHTFYHPV